MVCHGQFNNLFTILLSWMYEAFRCVMNNIQNASLFQRTAFKLITCWSTKESVAVLPTLFVRKSARTPALIFYRSNICFPLLRPFHLDWMERICSFLKENNAKVPRAGFRGRFSRSVLAQHCWSQLSELLGQDGKVSVLPSHPGWCIQCHTMGCRWVGFPGRMSSMHPLTLGRFYQFGPTTNT